MKEINFSKDIGELIDEKGTIYLGKRFDCVDIQSPNTSSSREDARRYLRIDLEMIAERRGAKAYEVVTSHIHDSGQEYDSQPYSAQLIALLYR